MAFNSQLLTFSTDAELRLQTTASDGTLVRTLGYYAVGDGGGGVFSWDAASTAADDWGLIICPTSITHPAPGRWKRIVEGCELSLCWFGGKPHTQLAYNANNGELNRIRIEKAFDAVVANPKYTTVRIPAVTHRPYSFDRAIKPRGSYIALVGDKKQTRLFFYNTGGIECWDANISSKVWIENLSLKDNLTTNDWINVNNDVAEGPDESKHGIFLNVPFEMYNVDIDEFKGDGIRVYGQSGDGGSGVPTDIGSTATGIPSSNANKWHMDLVKSSNNLGAGVSVYGADANGGTCTRSEFNSNGTWGILDNSWLGNKWDSPGVSYNSTQIGFKRQACYIWANKTVDGVTALHKYYFRAKQDTVGVAPTVVAEVAQNTEIWEGFGYENVGYYAEYSPTRHYMGSGAYTAGKKSFFRIVGRNSKPYGNRIDGYVSGNLVPPATNSLTLFVDALTTPVPMSLLDLDCDQNASVFISVYTETGQKSSELGPEVLNLGGTQETPAGSGNWTRANGGLSTDSYNASDRYKWGGGTVSFSYQPLLANAMTYSAGSHSINGVSTPIVTTFNSGGGMRFSGNNIVSMVLTAGHRWVWGSTNPTDAGNKFQFRGGNVSIHGGYLEIYNKDTANSNNKIFFANAAPTVGLTDAGYRIGDIALNGTITRGAVFGWRCIVAGTVGSGSPGTPGTWEPISFNKSVNATYTTTANTLVIGDANNIVECSNASLNTLTIPPNSSVAFAVGTTISVVQKGAGQTQLVAGSGVTLQSAGAKLKLNAQYSVASIYKSATDTWVASGDLVT